MPQQYQAIIFDVFGVLINFKKNPRALLKMGALSLHLELGSSEKIFDPIDPIVSLLKRCHQKKNRVYKLFILSNMKKKTTDVLVKNFPEIFSLFDGIVTSGITGFKKPDKRIYEYLLNLHTLDPTTCIFLDDKKNNIDAAANLGMTGILCDTIPSVEDRFRKLTLV